MAFALFAFAFGTLRLWLSLRLALDLDAAFTASSRVESLRRRWRRTTWIALGVQSFSLAVTLPFTWGISCPTRGLNVLIGYVFLTLAAALRLAFSATRLTC